MLYNPRAVFFTMPLALLAIGSELDPEVYEVVIIDGRLDADAEATLMSQLEGALCLGVTVLTGAPISDALRISRAAKRARPDLPVIWGGWHPSMFARECLAEPCRRCHGAGAGRRNVRRDRAATRRRPLAAKAARAAPSASPTARSARIRRARCNPSRSSARTTIGLIPVERYFALKGKRQLDYISSQGCNFRCAFCSDPFVYGRKWVGLDPTRMALRLTELWERYRFDDVNFQDETFFTRRDRIKSLAEQIVESGMKITWAGTMRADQGVRLPDEVWARCKQSGLRRLLVGVESGSDEMLKRIRKDIRIEQVFHTARKMRELRHRRAISRSSSAFPDESDASIARRSRARSDCAR